MGAGEGSSAAKHSKPTLTQETPPPPCPDWSSQMQAYYGAGATPPFFASTVASPTPHPYIWGGQHPMMPPYGTPVPYLYSPAGVYAHPSIPMTPSPAQPVAEMEAKAPDGKDRDPNKKSKGISGKANVVGSRNGESGKAASSSGNDGTTQSAESGNDGSSDASDENEQHMAVPGNPVVPTPASNLNMAIDLWHPSAGTGAVKMQPNPSGASQTSVPSPMMGREGMMPDQWAQQDERELKRQKRKQSNRESARRSRLRKQAECEELQARVQVLSNENHSLRDELHRLSEECKKLTSENNSMKDKLSEFCEPEAVSKLDAHLQSRADEGNI